MANGRKTCPGPADGEVALFGVGPCHQVVACKFLGGLRRFFANDLGSLLANDLANLGLGGGLGRGGHLGFHLALALLELVDLTIEYIILVLEALQGSEDVVEFLEFLQDLVAALLLRLHQVGERSDGFSHAAIADDVPLRVGDSNLDATVHPPPFAQIVVDGWAFLAERFDGDLARLRAVLHEEVAHRLRSLAAERGVVAVGAEMVGVSLELDAIVAVLRQQLREAQQAGIPVGQGPRGRRQS